MRIGLAAALIAVTASGCGGGGDRTEAGSTPTAPQAAGSARIGCDIAAECSTVNAEETLKRCPANRLDARGRKVRKRLERLLARIENVDLHNKQVDEAYAAAMTALEELERACLAVE